MGSEIYETTNSDEVALTFDDGPNDPYTLQIVDVLEKYKVKATFFMIGKYLRLRPDIALEVLKAGHLIANHTERHLDLKTLHADEVEAELQWCQKTIENEVGIRPSLFRPPFGSTSPQVNSIAKVLDLKPVLWSVIPEDYNSTISADRIFSRVLAAIGSRRQGEIILLHDGDGARFGADRSRTVTATDKLLQHFYSNKRFIKLDEIRS